MDQIPFKDNKIVMRIKDGKIIVNADVPVSFEDFLSACCTVLLGSMNDITSQQKPENVAECKGALYDTFNCMVSGVLEKFAPEFELRPNLTTKAILEAENKIIKEGRLNEVEPNT
jgi:hypothetical protein